ncbi:hypothetical protein ARHIZOSPH14_28240 [Agromyces rhizosphaerae]|uniref:Uncharacterized protein n=1 Tax=Agromyces rhizosphaerae TaxID=88374 RepID=A0A9W6D0I3_9MICO|nr:hypothetical protein [Agromyces rhizosphaerae]GLI28582.1 hypothetical protein ARHIZOSPH14_28240 [Agromyces rhizosphaerae]
MSTQIGTWNLTVKAPTGPQQFALRLEEGPKGYVLDGPDGDVEIPVIAFDGDDGVTFENDTDKPMKLHMSWNLLVEGDEMSGTVKPGVFPAQKVTGTRA